MPIQQAFPTGSKTTKDHVTEDVFSQREYIVYIESVCVCFPYMHVRISMFFNCNQYGSNILN